MTLLGRICSRSDREKTIYHLEHHNAHFDHFGDDTVEEPWAGDLRSGTISEDEFRATAYYWISVMHGSGLFYFYNVRTLSHMYKYFWILSTISVFIKHVKILTYMYEQCI